MLLVCSYCSLCGVRRVALRKHQEEEDARLARQSSLREEQTIKEKRERELQLSEQEAKRLEMEERQKLERKRRDNQLSEVEARRLYELQKLALERKKREQALSEAEVRRMRQLELGSGGGTSTQAGRWELAEILHVFMYCASCHVS